MAGAVVNGEIAAEARRRGVSLAQALARNDAYPAFEQLGGQVFTGPTSTNVSDVYILLVL